MTNDELKKKLVEIIINAIWKDAEADYDSTDETEACSIADALIAAGIGDTSDLEVKCEVLQRDVDNLTRTMEEGAEELKEAQHRAEVAEREAIILSKWLADKTRKNYPYQAWLDAAQKQAEKELAEERKDD